MPAARPTPSFLRYSVLVCCAGSLLVARSRAADQPGLTSSPAVQDLPGAATPAGSSTGGGNPPLQELKLSDQFDRNGDHWLDATERQAARAYLAQHPAGDLTPATGRPGQASLQAVPLEPVKPGELTSPTNVTSFSDQPLYDPHVLRTLFLDFEDHDWEQELADFSRTDIFVPARLILDGKTYSGVGIHLHRRAAASAFVPGYKSSLDLKLDYTAAGQGIGNQRELRLLDARTDPTFLRTILYHRVAREYGPAPLANFVRLVINGEDWGVYVSVQPFDENFLQAYFSTTAGARWIVGPGGNLAYLGDNPDAYRASYRLQSAEDPAAWAALIQLCKILNQTPAAELRAALEPHLDLDSTLMFLALQNTLLNQDGYGSNTGSYGLYLDVRGHFHLIPQDAEASLRLRQVSEYGNRQPDRGKGKPGKDGKPAEANDAVPKGYNPKDFPHQTGTNLAMVLSYSFINKADTDLDGKVTKDEWLGFARVWFLVMDEDFAGMLTREQFLAKVRLVITPTSITDGHTKQTYGKDDPAGVIGRDFFTAMDANHDGQLTPDELTATFARWFADWSDPKTGLLTQERLQQGFTALFSQSVFEADQAFITKHHELSPEETEPEGRRRDRSNGNTVDLGPLNLLGGLVGHNQSSRTLIVFHEELDPLDGLDDPTKPLLGKLLSISALRTKYLDFMTDIAQNWLTWDKLGPIAKEYHELIADDVAKDMHKAASYENFVQELDQDTTPGARDGGEAPSLRNFITERNGYLLKNDLLSGGN